ncbi:MAG: tetratricopeptide repeat protein [Rhodobacteraceae bacterium]|nr:tetratricopeptide repeat protein [Paracoccaceae bacterium]
MLLKPLVIAATCIALPMAAYAAGSESTSPPKPTQTTKDCKKGKVWDATKKKCVAPRESHLSDDVLYGAVREYAYAGQYDTAQKILSAMSDQTEDRVLTYWGFTHRKLGDRALGMAFYEKALKANPDNLLVRSYMGQAFIESGEVSLAKAQLKEIRARGGKGTWPETSLAKAIRTGSTYDY